MPDKRSARKGTKKSSATKAARDDAPGGFTDEERDAMPELASKLWYGMPAYAKDGAVVCFIQGAQKFKTRYSTIGFTDKAALDDGPMWPTAFALTELTSAVEARIIALVKKAYDVEKT